ncbi:UNVERIFIED_ORG: prophage antirepressor-like protein [Rhizobium esperanzae]|nr:prophage antirepressor-like protein [Rhizobium esperanzae]
MEHPRINAMFIVSHDESIPPMRLRFVEIDGASHFLAKDIAEYAGLQPEEDGDFRSTLAALGVPFVDSKVHDRGNTFGPVTLIAEHDARRLRAEAATKQNER